MTCSKCPRSFQNSHSIVFTSRDQLTTFLSSSRGNTLMGSAWSGGDFLSSLVAEMLRSCVSIMTFSEVPGLVEGNTVSERGMPSLKDKLMPGEQEVNTHQGYQVEASIGVCRQCLPVNECPQRWLISFIKIQLIKAVVNCDLIFIKSFGDL